MCFPTQTHGKITSQSPSGQSCLCTHIHDVSSVPVRTQSPKALWINCMPFRTCLSVFRMLWMRWRPLEREWRSTFSGLTSFLSDFFLQLFVVKLLGVTCDFSDTSSWMFFFNEALLCLSFSTRSTFNWTVPFLSWLAITALCLATFLLYLIPLRYLVLAWGESWFHNTQMTTQTDKKCYAMLVERWCTGKEVSVTFLWGSRSFTSKLWNMALALGGWGLCSPSRCLMKYLVLIFLFILRLWINL